MRCCSRTCIYDGVLYSAGCLPHVVAELHESAGSSSALLQRGVDFETHALQSLYQAYPALHGTHLQHGQSGDSTATADCGGQLGATGQLAWAGDIAHLRE